MDRIFSLTGAVVDNRQNKIPNLRLAIVDRDPVIDDLIGVGFTDENGQFRISFTTSEFNQEWFESENKPDIYIVFSGYFDGEYRAIFRKDFSSLKFESLSEDLGTVVIDTWDDAPEILIGVDPTPGYEKNINRLQVDNELVRHCLNEVTPLVENLTGWSDLLEGLSVDVTDNFENHMSELVDRAGMTPDPNVLKMFSKIIFNSILALCDPLSNKLIVNKTKTSKLNLDALKVTMGHELVHVGQFKYHPVLITENEKSWEWLKDILEKDQSMSLKELIDKIQSSPFNNQLTRIEGYAYYIQKDFLERHYNCATFFLHRSFFEIILGTILKKFFPELESLADLKTNQYLEGRNIFLDRREGNYPAAFHPEDD
jgi:hypothetical protein